MTATYTSCWPRALTAPTRKMDSAYDGQEGLERFEAAAYDLVLTDVNMPRLDGMALLARIRMLRPATKVVVMTVANTPETLIHAIRQEAFAYFSKPFTLSAVEEIVNQAWPALPRKTTSRCFRRARSGWSFACAAERDGQSDIAISAGAQDRASTGRGRQRRHGFPGAFV